MIDMYRSEAGFDMDNAERGQKLLMRNFNKDYQRFVLKSLFNKNTRQQWINTTWNKL